MANYKVLDKCFINNRIYEVGDVVEFDGAPGPHLELIEEPKKRKQQPAAGVESTDLL